MKLWILLEILVVSPIFCGAKSLNEISPKIIGGRSAHENEFPYMVSIRRAELQYIFNNYYHICGGSILDEDTVITAAHCLHDPFGNPLTAPGSFLVAANFTRMWSDFDIVQEFEVLEVFIHPEYDPDLLINDIAILKIETSFNFTQIGMKPISMDFERDFAEGTNCSVHGWGTLLSEFPLMPDELQTVDLLISNHTHCNETYAGIVTKNQVCAYETNKDSCAGDSGGAFVCNDLLVGIVSYGYGCAQPGIPGVYTKVSSYQEFIKNYREYTKSSSVSIRGSLLAILVTIVTVAINYLIPV